MVKKRIFVFICVLLLLNFSVVLATKSCTETDRGNNIGRDGTVTFYDDTEDDTLTFTDSCRSYKERYVLTEYFCDGRVYDTEDYYCTSCVTGTRDCYPKEDVSASFSYEETDDGKDYTTKGSVYTTTTYQSDGTEISSGPTSTRTDTCNNYGVAKGQLREYSVSAKGVVSENVDCSTVGRKYVCEDGACVPPSTSASADFLRAASISSSSAVGAWVALAIVGIGTAAYFVTKKKNTTKKRRRKK